MQEFCPENITYAIYIYYMSM